MFNDANETAQDQTATQLLMKQQLLDFADELIKSINDVKGQLTLDGQESIALES